MGVWGVAEDAQAQASACHKLFRRTTHLVQAKSDRKLSGLRAVNSSANAFLIALNGRTGKYA